MKNTIKIFSILALGIFLLNLASAMTVYGDFTDGSQSATITEGDSISFNVDFLSMSPPMTIKAQIYSGDSLFYSFLNTNTNQKSYYNTYTYVATEAGTYTIKIIGTDKTNTDSEFLTLTVNPAPIPINHAPVITSTPITVVNEGASYYYDVQATDSDGDVLTYSLNEKPSWLSINSVTGIISGMAPWVFDDTPFSVTVQVSDGEDVDTQSYTLTVKDTYVPPTDTIKPVVTIQAPINGQTYSSTSISLKFTATDANLESCWYDAESSGAGITCVSGVQKIIPLTAHEGTNTWTVFAEDAAGNVGSKTVTFYVNTPIPINHAPVITSTPITVVNEGASYYYDVQATDSDGDVLTYSLTEKPSWLSINSVTGIISGMAPWVFDDTPFSVTVQVSDGEDVDTQSYTLTVKDTYVPPTDTIKPVVTIQAPINGQTYSSTSISLKFTATDANLESCWYDAESSGAGITCVSGVQKIIPLTAHEGTNTWTVFAEDAAGNVGSKTVTFYVNTPIPINHAPVITSSPVTIVNEGASYYYDVQATDSDGDVLTYSLNEKPSWLSINSVTGIISGMAPWVFDDTPFSVTVQVSDGEDVDTQSYTLTVKDTYVPPCDDDSPAITVLGSNPVTIIKGDIYTEAGATAWDDEDGDLTDEIIIDSDDVDTGVIGTYKVTYSVEDSSGNWATATRTVNVVACDDDEEDDDDCDSCKKVIIKTNATSTDNRLEEFRYFHQYEKGKTVYIYNDIPKKTSWFQRMINSIVNAFKWLFGIK